MNRAKHLLTVVLGGFVFLAGCAGRGKFKTVEQICVPDLDKPAAMEAAEDVLGEMHFTINKADAEGGYIRTRPLQGAQFFEFWRSDNVGAYNWSEANLHNVRRIVELDISEKGKQLCIGCNVKAERLSIAGREVVSGSQAYAMFSASRPAMQRLRLGKEQKADMAWIDLGRDVRLETEILRRIENKISKP